MRLLAFAHKNEANSFLQHFSMSLIPGHQTLWKQDNLLVLITGEGHFESLHQMTKTLSTFPEIEDVINIGVAGALTDKFKTMDIIHGRTCYFHDGHEPVFKSFPCHKNNHVEPHDILTTSKRILDNGEKKKLSPFAHIVDRESWSIGYACSKDKKPFHVVKIISDDLSQEDGVEICEIVKEKAQEFSESLLKYYLENIHAQDMASQDDKKDLPLLDIVHSPDFYFTTSMKRLFVSYLRKAEKLELLEKPLDLEFIVQSIVKPKDRAQYLIESLIERINPARKEITSNLDSLCSPLKKSGWVVKYDNNIEEDWISVSGKVKNNKELFKLSNTLKDFPLEEWQEIFEGKD